MGRGIEGLGLRIWGCGMENRGRGEIGSLFTNVKWKWKWKIRMKIGNVSRETWGRWEMKIRIENGEWKKRTKIGFVLFWGVG
jgi:hypothetical protein